MNTALKMNNTSVENAEYLNALLDTIIINTEKVNRELGDCHLIVEENALALEMYLNLFSMDYIKSCAKDGVDAKSYIVRDVVPLITESGERFYVRLRNALPFPCGFKDPSPLPDNHEYVDQFRSLISRHRDIDNSPLIKTLREGLDALRGTCSSESVLRARAADLGPFVKRALVDMDTQRAMFVTIVCKNGSLL